MDSHGETTGNTRPPHSRVDLTAGSRKETWLEVTTHQESALALLAKESAMRTSSSSGCRVQSAGCVKGSAFGVQGRASVDERNASRSKPEVDSLRRRERDRNDGGPSGTIFGTGGCPPSLLRSYGGQPSRNGYLTRPANGSRERNERLTKVGGERGIRTLGRVSPTHAFQACSFNHSDISPL